LSCRFLGTFWLATTLGRDILRATVAADVDPSVAPPKIFANVGCPIQSERSKSPLPSAFSGWNRVRSSGERAQRVRFKPLNRAATSARTAIQFNQPDSACVAASRGPATARLQTRPPRPVGRSSPTDTTHVAASSRQQHVIVRRCGAMSSNFFDSNILCGATTCIRSPDVFRASASRTNTRR
jgi:hypothetical protein